MVKALSPLAQKGLLGEEKVLQHELGGVRGVEAKLLLLPPYL